MTQTVQLMITCILDTLHPEIGEAVVKVLERAGVSVAFPPEQTCCGQPAFNAGMRAEARRMAQHTIEVFEAAPGLVVIPSGSCAAMLRHGYLELFANDPPWLERAQTLAKRTYEFSEFLVDVLGVTDLGAVYPGPVTYHASCHLLRELGVDRQPKALLATVRSMDASGKDGPLEVLPLTGAEECCGFGGVFSAEQPEISTAMLERKLENLQQSGAPVLVSCDAGCLMNINGGLRRRGRSQRGLHLAEILAHTAEDDAV